MQEIGLVKSSPGNTYLSKGLFCQFLPPDRECLIPDRLPELLSGRAEGQQLQGLGLHPCRGRWRVTGFMAALSATIRDGTVCSG